MGRGYSLLCKKCGKYKLEVRYGIGMMDAPYFYELPPSNDKSNWKKVITSKRILNEIEDILVNKNGKFNSDNYGWKTYYSDEYLKLYNLFYFEINYVEEGINKTYIPPYKDRKRNLLRIIEEDDLGDIKIRCPKCKQIIDFTSEDSMFEPDWMYVFHWD